MKIVRYCCVAATMLTPLAAHAQSTGSIETSDEIVVTGMMQRKPIAGILIPDSPKAKAEISQTLLARQNSGQTVLNAINQVAGVNFTNSDPYGSSGGNIRIRGFDGPRISLTLDGMPLNDTGNYAIFSNQLLDPELIEQVNVNLGTTDVDSPTASSSGGTVNVRTRLPSEQAGIAGSFSLGDYRYRRYFVMADTGTFGPLGTRAFFSFSSASNDKFKGPGGISKHQFNGRLYQPIGDNGDFIAIAGHYNRNRNDFYRNPSLSDLRTLTGLPLVADPAAPAEIGGFSLIQQGAVNRFDNFATCTRDTPTAGAVDDEGAGSSSNIANTASCSNFYGVRINPSNTANIRIQSRFTLADNLKLTVDPSYQYVLAHGGGSTVLAENSAVLKGSVAGSPGVDLNGDGDFLDKIRLITPNITNTRRLGVTASLIWDVTPDHRLRIAYTYDRGRHRQTGEYGYLEATGLPENAFSGRGGRPVQAADGSIVQQRDRKSIALLNQIAGQYVGKFMDGRFRVDLGVRAPFFRRQLNQYCYTQISNGFANCTTQPGGPTPAASFIAPFTATYKYNKVLPNAGFTFAVTDAVDLYGSYAKGFSAPRTDNLYRARLVTVKPETTDAFDLGLRYGSPNLSVQVGGWIINYQNRIVTSFNQDLGISIDRNVGKVNSYGFDGSIAFRPVRPLSLYAFGSYTHAEMKEDIAISSVAVAPTRGKMVAETPKWQFGGRAEADFGWVSLGLQAKHVGKRFATDVNDVVVKGYTTVDLDARVTLEKIGLKDTWFQLNVTNLLNERYYGNISTQINAAGGPSFALGAPQAIMGTVRVGF